MDDTMDISWFRDLANLRETGNFSQAAKISNISQPAFSRRIKALEDWVGTGLVVRNNHPIRLTNAGDQMLEASRQALDRLDRERALVLEAAMQPDKYVVTFGAQHSIGWRFYPAWLQAFETAYGPIMSSLRADDLPNCLTAMQKGEIDFVIAYESTEATILPSRSNMGRVRIGSDKLIPVSRPDASGSPLFDLTDEKVSMIPWLRFGDAAPITRHIEPLLNRSGLRARLNIVYENSMAGALRIRARDGAGIVWLPQSLVRLDIESGSLVLAGTEAHAIDLDICLYRDEPGTNQLTRDIWAFLARREQTPLVRAL